MLATRGQIPWLMRLKKLKEVLVSESWDVGANACAELIQFLDEKSLAPVMRDAIED